jgi:hypothetical protein
MKKKILSMFEISTIEKKPFRVLSTYIHMFEISTIEKKISCSVYRCLRFPRLKRENSFPELSFQKMTHNIFGPAKNVAGVFFYKASKFQKPE